MGSSWWGFGGVVLVASLVSWRVGGAVGGVGVGGRALAEEPW